MNGDKVYNKLQELDTKQEERHRENKEVLKVIFKKIQKLDDLPCDVHIERMSGIAKNMGDFKKLFGGIFAAILGIIGWLFHLHGR